MIPVLFVFGNEALLLLRLGFGLIFLLHGWPKIKDLRTNAQNFEMMGFKPGVFWGFVVAGVEFFGGLFLIFGLFTQPAALLLAVNMLVAMVWKMKNGQSLLGGYELDLLLFLTGLMLAASGGGPYSFDGYWSLWLL